MIRLALLGTMLFEVHGRALAQPSAPGPATAAAAPADRGGADDPSGHDGQVGAVLREEIDLENGNGGPAFGVAMGLGSRLQLDALIVTESHHGLRLAWSFFFRPERALKPFLRAGATFVGRDGTRSGIHGGGGVVYDVASWVGLALDFAADHFFDMPDGVDGTALRVSAGLEIRNPR